MKIKMKQLCGGLAAFSLCISMAAVPVSCCASETENTEEESFAEETVSLERWEETLDAEEFSGLTSEAMRGVKVIQDGETLLAVSYEPREYRNSYDCWALSVPYHSLVSVDTEAMYEYFENVEQLQLEKTEEGSGEIDGSTSVFLAWYAGQTEEGGQAEPDSGLKLLIGEKDGNGHYYVEDAGTEEIYLADETAVDALLSPDPYAMVLRVVNVVNRDTVSSLEISVDDDTYVMSEEDETCYFDGKEVDESEYKELYTAILSCYIEEELPEDFEPESDRTPVLQLIYHRNQEEAPEITLDYYPYDEEYVTAWINGQEYFLVSKDDVEDLIKQIRKAF